jgi:topoisomerase-4 subunit B
LLNESDTKTQFIYPVVHFKSDDFEIAFTHSNQYGEDYYSYVNGQHTIQGGTHLSAFKESLVRTLREFYKKDFEPIDIRASIVAAVSIKIQDPVFESQTKTKLGSNEVSPGGETIRVFINKYIKKKLDDFLHKNSDISQKLLDKILSSQKERKEISAIKKIAKKTSKKADLHNKKLRDCKVHLNDLRRDIAVRKKSMIFITEGDSASGSITKIRDPQTQAVFSLRGKPLNSFGLSRKIVYQNEEFNLLQHALNIENGIENLRYNKIIIATDADVDGMHIRLLLLTFFLQFFNKVVKNNHLYILETPLFRVRNKKKTFYCYDEEERDNAIEKLGKSSIEITRFKGLGEINPDEFKLFISKNIRLKPVEVSQNSSIDEILKYYMGKNTQDRQEYIINNLIDYGDVV